MLTFSAKIKRSEPALITQLQQYPSSIVSDAMQRFGALDCEIRPLGKNTNFCGPAITVDEIEGGNGTIHLALSYTKPGDVLMINARGTETRAVWGGILTTAAEVKSLSGVVVDGVVRDAEDIAKASLPVFGRGFNPAGPHKDWLGRLNTPTSVGGVAVCPGDIILGDTDGVVVVPYADLREVIARCKQITSKEIEIIKRIKSGEETKDLLNLDELLKRFESKITE